MFRTKLKNKYGRPGTMSEELSHWLKVSRDRSLHWYHVSLEVRREGRMISHVVMLNDETKLLETLEDPRADRVVMDVKVVTPGWMNKKGEWLMEKLAGVSVGVEKNDIPVCVLELANGSIYTDSNDPSITKESLSDVLKIY
ncbi:hypothetical protein [Pseudomonas sp. BF-B-25]|uniref:hypothetical protein n=1 Tax=Pseudomonas sp. BF-B-25 TaxID=2832355 RepID=UPI001CBD4B0A|nr:hypothetical protein [Pseudomonas sp. BF-B-25]